MLRRGPSLTSVRKDGPYGRSSVSLHRSTKSCPPWHFLNFHLQGVYGSRDEKEAGGTHAVERQWYRAELHGQYTGDTRATHRQYTGNTQAIHGQQHPLPSSPPCPPNSTAPPQVVPPTRTLERGSFHCSPSSACRERRESPGRSVLAGRIAVSAPPPPDRWPPDQQAPAEQDDDHGQDDNHGWQKKVWGQVDWHLDLKTAGTTFSRGRGRGARGRCRMSWEPVPKPLQSMPLPAPSPRTTA